MLPKKLKNFNLYIDGKNFAGIVEEITLPNLKRKFEEFRPGGFNAPIDSDMGMEKLEASFILHELSVRILKKFGIAAVDGVSLRFMGAAVSDGAGSTTDAIEVVMRGRYSEMELPSGYKAGESGMMKLGAPLTYFKYIINGETLIEIDVINMIEIVDGVDRLKEQRDALGLG